MCALSCGYVGFIVGCWFCFSIGHATSKCCMRTFDNICPHNCVVACMRLITYVCSLRACMVRCTHAHIHNHTHTHTRVFCCVKYQVNYQMKSELTSTICNLLGEVTNNVPMCHANVYRLQVMVQRAK